MFCPGKDNLFAQATACQVAGILSVQDLVVLGFHAVYIGMIWGVILGLYRNRISGSYLKNAKSNGTGNGP